MPFVITCPECARTFRSAREREIGKGVECAKCGAQFYVSAENQEEVRDDPPRREPAGDRPSRRPRDHDDDEAPRRRPRDGNDEEAPRPRRKPGGRKKVLLLLAVAALGLFLLCGGVGAYLLFFGGNGTSAEDKLRARRDLPTDLFAFRPSDRASIDLYNFGLSREPDYDPSNMPSVETTLPGGHGISRDQIEFLCRMSESGNNQVPPVEALSLGNPADVAAVAARCKMDPLPGRPGVFAKAGWVVFQPDPKKLVFVGSNFEKKWTPDVLAKVADRPAEAVGLPAKYADGLAMASGYAHIYAAYRAAGEQEYNVTGDYWEKSGVREQFAVRFFKSPEAARKSYESEKKLWTGLSAKAGGNTTNMPDLWVRGDRNYYFNRQQMGKGPRR